MQSKASTVSDYLAELPPDRSAIIQQVRAVILKNLDPEIEEGMQYGMIGYYIPHHVYPPGYHCDPKQPLPYVCLASQKNYLSLYMMGLYTDEREERDFRERWAATGKKLDMGKCCIRFKRIEDVALDLVAEAIKSRSAKKHIAQYEAIRAAELAAKPARAAKKKR